MRLKKNSAPRAALLAAASLAVTLSMSTESRLFREVPAPKNIRLVNAKPVLGLPRPAKPSGKEYYWLLARSSHPPYRKGKSSR